MGLGSSSLGLQMMDMSGRGQQKFIHCFEHVPYRLFIVALSDYDPCHTPDSRIVHFTVSVSERGVPDLTIIIYAKRWRSSTRW